MKKKLIDSSSKSHLPAFAHDPMDVVEAIMQDKCAFIHVEGNRGLFFISVNGSMESLMSQ